MAATINRHYSYQKRWWGRVEGRGWVDLVFSHELIRLFRVLQQVHVLISR